MMVNALSLSITFVVIIVNIRNTFGDGCEPTITTVEGKRAPTNRLCRGQLIFSENFDEIDPLTWIHEERMSAVRAYITKTI